MTDREALVRSRGGYKGVITKWINKIDSAIAAGNVNTLSSIKDLFIKQMKTVQELNEKILALTTEEERMNEVEEQAEYEVVIGEHWYKLINAITAISGSGSPGNPPTTPKINIRLPKLDLPHYTGDVLEWNSFWELYNVSVHQRGDLEPIQKFSYLQSLLTGDALKLISGFKLEAANYSQAISLLQATYGKRDEIKRVLVRRLLEMESPSANSESLQTFRANFECSIRSLESENLELNELYTILLYGKLPKSVSETVKRRCGDDWLVFDTFKKYLEEEIHNLRSFVSVDVNKPGTLSTISTFTVNQSQSVRPKSKGNVNKFSSQQARKCALCEGEHWWTQCKTYASRDKRLSRLGFLRLCFVCASNKHFSVDCEKQSCGNGCRLKHHRVLCDKQQTSEPSKPASKSTIKSANKPASKPNNNGVQVGTLSVSDQGQKSKQRSILPTATIVLKGKGRHLVRLRGLLDTCAERTFIRRSALKDVQYRSKGTEKIVLRGYLTSKPVNEYETVSVSIPYKGRLIIMDCIVVDELPEYTKKFNVKRNLKTLCKTKICLADKDFDLPVDKQAPIDMLVGVDNVYNILHPGFRKAGKLILLPTIFGYVVTGSCNAPPVQETQVTVLKLAINEEVIEATHKYDNDVKNDLDILWNLDKVGIDCNELREHDRKVLEDFENTIVYSEMEKQYVVALPWKSNKPRLPSNYGMALGRVKQQCAKFQKDEAYLNHYQKILKDQEDRGFIERVDKSKSVENCHYLAHHSVQKDSVTTPIRIVFDCSWRQGKNGLSLNDCLWTGPHITTDLLKFLLQFRTNNYACISDIEKAFLMVQLREEDRNYTRFLWLQDPTDPNSELIIYRFRVVLFGATCSPFLLNATIKSHLAAVRKDTNCTEMVDMMKRGLYVDNLQFTSNSEDQLINLFFGANKIFAQAHLYLKEWTSNSDLLNTVADAYHIKSKEKQTYKVLGLNWNISSDELTITPNHLKTGQTKREILSAIAQIYDPLGVLIPITIRARIFLQDLWKQQLKWDDLLSVPLLKQWNELSNDLEKSLSISFSRSTNLEKADYLHIFCDASITAYGCVAYRASGKTSSLIMAKGRVAPIKELTVPKLELMALLLGARLCKFIVETFEENKFEKIIIWSDSKVALGWLVTKNNLPVFVKNRVLEINSITAGIVFSYVPSSENPSDWITRGKKTEEVRNNSFWWEGPPWLKSENHTYPIDRTWVKEAQTQEVIQVHLVGNSEKTHLLTWERFSRVDKFCKTIAWIMRFIHNCKSTGCRKIGSLTLEELQQAKNKMIILLQKEYFPEEYKALERGDKVSKLTLLVQLNLFLEEGIIRCRGRLEHVAQAAEIKFPILLPKSCFLTRLIVREHHCSQAHMGVNATVASVRQEYWVPQLRQLSKSVIHHCIICKKTQGRPYRVNIAPPLPEFRVQRKQPFSVTGVDYTGALLTKEKHQNPEKAYIVLFTCPVTRGIHIELVKDLSCDSFLMVFRKFCSRRGFPSLMLSDNATTFVSASDYLKNMAESSLVQEHLNAIECKWKFIPARAPWFGAIWERLIGLLKTCLKKVIGQAFLSFSELSCVVTELEAIINDRPLSYTPGDLDQLDILTPNHLILGRRLRSFPREVIDWKDETKDPLYGENKDVGKRFLYITKKCDDLWKRWEREYLTSLRETHRVGIRHEFWPKMGDVVLIHDEGPRSRWKLGQIVKLHVGPDDVLRVVTLKTPQGQVMRPVVKLYPLELWQETDVVISEKTDNKNTRPIRKTAQAATEARRTLIQAGQL